jgi:hypothetical protein
MFEVAAVLNASVNIFLLASVTGLSPTSYEYTECHRCQLPLCTERVAFRVK